MQYTALIGVSFCLTELFIKQGVPENIRSDNDSEFTAKTLCDWLHSAGV